jgi:hypothetical protein
VSAADAFTLPPRTRNDIMTTSKHNIADKRVLMHLYDGRTRLNKAASMLLPSDILFNDKRSTTLALTRSTTTQRSSIFFYNQDTPNVSENMTTSLTCRDQMSQYRLPFRSTARQSSAEHTVDNDLFRKQSTSQEQRHKTRTTLFPS